MDDEIELLLTSSAILPQFVGSSGSCAHGGCALSSETLETLFGRQFIERAQPAVCPGDRYRGVTSPGPRLNMYSGLPDRSSER